MISPYFTKAQGELRGASFVRGWDYNFINELRKFRHGHLEVTDASPVENPGELGIQEANHP
jgi:hypothetical protein